FLAAAASRSFFTPAWTSAGVPLVNQVADGKPARRTPWPRACPTSLAAACCVLLAGLTYSVVLGPSTALSAAAGAAAVTNHEPARAAARAAADKRVRISFQCPAVGLPSGIKASLGRPSGPCQAESSPWTVHARPAPRR